MRNVDACWDAQSAVIERRVRRTNGGASTRRDTRNSFTKQHWPWWCRRRSPPSRGDDGKHDALRMARCDRVGGSLVAIVTSLRTRSGTKDHQKLLTIASWRRGRLTGCGVSIATCFSPGSRHRSLRSCQSAAPHRMSSDSEFRRSLSDEIDSACSTPAADRRRRRHERRPLRAL